MDEQWYCEPLYLVKRGSARDVLATMVTTPDRHYCTYFVAFYCVCSSARQDSILVNMDVPKAKATKEFEGEENR